MKSGDSEVPPDVDFQIPTWAGKAPSGTHLDVYKGDKLLQKLMIDEKRCYFFGRNPQLCDIAVEHASCSRVHAALLYHQHLNRCFLVDLGSAHGTFISNVKLESNKPEQLQYDQVFRFGASTRRYILREKPTSNFYSLNSQEISDEFMGMSRKDGNSTLRFLNLPEKEEELENLTEYNTALNRRIATMSVPEENFPAYKRNRGAGHVGFKDDEEVINPEDIDPNVGKFRNLVQTAVISTKRQKLGHDHYNLSALSNNQNPSNHSLHPSSMIGGHGQQNLPPNHNAQNHQLGSKLGLPISLNIAPEIELYPKSLLDAVAPKSMAPKHAAVDQQKAVVQEIFGTEAHHLNDFYEEDGTAGGGKKKKYAKEAWPGKKPGQGLLM